MDFWRIPDQRLAEIADIVHADLRSSADLCFEHEVPVEAGRGKSSCTDLMIRGEQVAIAIEAKYTEPRYESVKNWQREPPEENRDEVLRGWLGLINRVTGSSLKKNDVADLPYQLIHRTASVCASESKSRWVIYQVFGSHAPDHYLIDMTALHCKIGSPTTLKLVVLMQPIDPLSAQRELEKRWEEGDRALGTDIRAALLAGSLFSFGASTVRFAECHDSVYQ